MEHFVWIMMKVILVEPSWGLKKEKGEEIMKSVVKEENLKLGVGGKKFKETKRIEPPPTLLKKDYDSNKPLLLSKHK